ncbi:hypothetical protein BKA65DRAFT_557271 [Rhexocercosporidium sp. MPI-PUGE-AT-0058]|nr:hypothetical protein BKA65DRAFT_557271 [Rhexocercosporidium sp. MPI-PUGE-AT-0058]
MPPQRCTRCNTTSATNTGTNPENPKSSTTKCPLCNVVSYCSFDCYTADSSSHNILCSTYSTFTSKSTRPSTSHKLAILLPCEVAKPKFIWLKTRLHSGDWESADFEDHLGPDQPGSKSFYITRELSAAKPAEKRYKNLNRTLILDCRAEFEDDGSMRNWCMERLTEEKLAKQWNGPMIVTSKSGSGATPPFYDDFDIGDISLVRDFLRMYVLPNHDTVQGVRIRCLGEQNILKRSTFSPILMSKGHEIFSMKDFAARIIPVTRSMGIPLLIYNDGNVDYAKQDITASQKKAVQSDKHFTKNPAVTFLTLDTDVRSKTWGAPRQVESLVGYCRDVLYPGMEKRMKELEGQSSLRTIKIKEEVVTKLMCQAKFDIYFKYVKDIKKIADSSWAQERSPYNT